MDVLVKAVAVEGTNGRQRCRRWNRWGEREAALTAVKEAGGCQGYGNCVNCNGILQFDIGIDTYRNG